VETVNGQLAGRYNAERLRARGLWHPGHRPTRKILSHAVIVRVNVKAGRPPLQLPALMAA
jgi:hypothetical protein